MQHVLDARLNGYVYTVSLGLDIGVLRFKLWTRGFKFRPSNHQTRSSSSQVAIASEEAACLLNSLPLYSFSVLLPSAPPHSPSLSYPSHHLPHSTPASLTIFLLHLLPSPLFFLRSILVASQTRVYKLEPRSYELQTHQYVQGKQFELALQVAVSL